MLSWNWIIYMLMLAAFGSIIFAIVWVEVKG
jgi:hypothetical protein